MPSPIRLDCAGCGSSLELRPAEYNRQLRQGRDYFFCSRSCAARFSNRSRRNRQIEKECPLCGKVFVSHTGSKAATFCSRSCASAGSVTPARRNAAKATSVNLAAGRSPEAVARSLRKREWWKYEEVDKVLTLLGVAHEFEHVVDRYIFDLALFDKKVLVEFDGKDHSWAEQQHNDRAKRSTARCLGWSVVVVATKVMAPIRPSQVLELLSD